MMTDELTSLQAENAELRAEIERMKGQQEPVAFIHTCKSGETLSWFGESSNAASRPDFIKSTPLYPAPPDRTAELEAALKVARDGIDEFLVANDQTEFGCACDLSVGYLCGPCHADMQQEPLKIALAKINEVLK